MREATEDTVSSNVVELLLREPEIVAWLEPADEPDDDDYEPPRAA